VASIFSILVVCELSYTLIIVVLCGCFLYFNGVAHDMVLVAAIFAFIHGRKWEEIIWLVQKEDMVTT
jgi:hypothetical protein